MAAPPPPPAPTFLTIPLELRNKIYTFVLTSTSFTSRIPPDWGSQPSSPQSSSKNDSVFALMPHPPSLPSIAFASHATYSEILSLLSSHLSIHLLFCYTFGNLPEQSWFCGPRLIDEVWRNGHPLPHKETYNPSTSSILENHLTIFGDYFMGQENSNGTYERLLKRAPRVCMTLSIRPAGEGGFESLGRVTGQGTYDVTVLEEVVVTLSNLSRYVKDSGKIFGFVEEMQMVGYPGIEWLKEKREDPKEEGEEELGGAVMTEWQAKVAVNAYMSSRS